MNPIRKQSVTEEFELGRGERELKGNDTDTSTFLPSRCFGQTPAWQVLYNTCYLMNIIFIKYHPLHKNINGPCVRIGLMDEEKFIHMNSVSYKNRHRIRLSI